MSAIGKITIITGGISSGKSAFALEQAWQHCPHPYFIATGFATDEEMQSKIKAHQHQRQGRVHLIEEPINLKNVCHDLKNTVVVIDSLSFWLFNIMEAQWDWCQLEKEISTVCSLAYDQKLHIIFVGDEMGLSVISMDQGTRKFCQWNGQLNQFIAKKADQFSLVVAGIPVVIKDSSKDGQH